MEKFKRTPEQEAQLAALIRRQEMEMQRDKRGVRPRRGGGIQVDDITLDSKPARPTQGGGLMWHHRRQIDATRADRDSKRTGKTVHTCPACNERFTGRKTAKYCSPKCKARILMRKHRAKPRLSRIRHLIGEGECVTPSVPPVH